MGPIIKVLLRSPDYKMKDFKAIMVNGYMKNTSLWKEIIRINLTEQLRNVKVPYIILRGDTDIVASTSVVKELVADSNNTYLDCKVVADTGHMLGAENRKPGEFFRKPVEKAGRYMLQCAYLYQRGGWHDMEKKYARVRYVNEKTLAIILSVALLLLMLPIIYIGKYNKPVADDYNYSVLTRHAWEETHSVFRVIAAAAKQAGISYRSWQGTFSSIFLMALMPALFDYRMYKLVAGLMVFILCFSAFALAKTVLYHLAGLEHRYWVITGGALSILTVEKMYTIPSGIFWYNAAVHYTFMHGLMLLFISAMIRVVLAKKISAVIAWAATATLLAVAVGGSNYATCLMGSACAVSILVLLSIRYKKKVFPCVIPAAVLLISFIVNIAAPGNGAREAYYNGFGAVSSILSSFGSAFRYCGKWMDLFTFLMLLLLAPVLWNITRRMRFRFPMPGLVGLYCFCILASGFTSSYYGMGFEGLSRTHNVIKTTYFFLLVFNEAYLLGWVGKKYGIEREAKLHTGYLLALVLLMGCSVFLAENKVGTFTTYASVYYVKTNEAPMFYAEYMERKAILESEEQDVVLKSFVNRPWLLYVDDITEDASDWRNTSVKEWYHKNSVRLLPDS